MTMKSIMVPLEESETLDSTLATALLVARRFGSYIEGLCIRPTLAGAIAVGFEGGAAALSGTEEQFEQEQMARARRLRERFDTFTRAAGLAKETRPGEAGPSVGWVEDEAAGIGIFGQRGRMFDLTVVGRPVPGALTPAMNTLETVLFEAGRPILIAPPKAPASVGDTIVISWNGATETALTVNCAMPFLEKASRVIVLSVEGAMVPGPSGEDVVTHLARNGIRAEAQSSPGRRTPATAGREILEQAARLGADLVVKGGYTHSRLRQMIFGGATNHILNNAEVPVLMAH